ncbi:hypothetical protein CBR_g49198 [Chara braunii]|uniref:Uncharacterized protein n=1 Tax=Chara braunii TaxID=69332 RepID=A0A388M489_CHABU|nr:hypothetical protein CBR_g49198 [Chara braunii]|eukprot:GBG89408.1 hypothetical protein CBR_g49198 [Chara braunii]
MKLELTESLDKVYKAIDGRKSNDGDDVAKLKTTVNDMQRRLNGGVASTSSVAPSVEGEELARLDREQAEIKTATEKRLSALEDVVLALQRKCEEAEENVEKWKSEALRPGNKRGSIAVDPTPSSHARFRMEVEALQTLQISEMNARKESEEEVERLKESLAKLDMEKRARVRGTNLKSKFNNAAVREKDPENDVGPSARKCKDKVVSGSASKSVDRKAFLRANRCDLRGKNKELVMGICEKRGLHIQLLSRRRRL